MVGLSACGVSCRVLAGDAIYVEDDLPVLLARAGAGGGGRL